MIRDMSSYLVINALATGAALTVGLLTFSGMFALLPSIPLALIAMVLAVAYEGEVYVQNINEAWDKLFKPHNHERMLARDYLRKYTPLAGKYRPQFFEDLLNTLNVLDIYEHTNNAEYDPQIQALKEQIDRMEEYFSRQMFRIDAIEQDPLCDFLHRYSGWYQNNSAPGAGWTKQVPIPQDPTIIIASYVKLLNTEKEYLPILQWMSIFAGLAMCLGTTYLLVEAFTILSFILLVPIALWPIFILPLAMLAGAAYGLLTYNALTDMMHNQTIQTWLEKLTNDTTWIISIGIVVLLALTLALTICTAGTWWTIVQEINPVFVWMQAVPVMIFQVILSVIIGIATLAFNIQNTMDTVDFFCEKLPEILSQQGQKIFGLPAKVIAQLSYENFIQALNPFRMIRVLIAEPLRYLLFIGHLMSEALGSTRLPGIPDTWSTAFGFISNFFQDFLYFFNDDESHDHSDSQLLNNYFDSSGHDHGDDLPTQCLATLFYPVLTAELEWDFYTSQLNQIPLNRAQAHQRQGGPIKHELSADQMRDISRMSTNLFKSRADNSEKDLPRRRRSSGLSMLCFSGGCQQHVSQPTQMGLG